MKLQSAIIIPPTYLKSNYMKIMNSLYSTKLSFWSLNYLISIGLVS